MPPPLPCCLNPTQNTNGEDFCSSLIVACKSVLEAPIVPADWLRAAHEIGHAVVNKLTAEADRADLNAALRVFADEVEDDFPVEAARLISEATQPTASQTILERLDIRLPDRLRNRLGHTKAEVERLEPVAAARHSDFLPGDF